MSGWTPAPTRFIDLAPENDSDQVGDMIRSARATPEFELSGLKWRIRSSLRREGQRRRRGLRVVLVAGLFFAAGSVVGAVLHPIIRQVVRPPQPRAEDAPPALANRMPHHRRPASVNAGEPMATDAPAPALVDQPPLAPPASPTAKPPIAVPASPAEAKGTARVAAQHAGKRMAMREPWLPTPTDPRGPGGDPPSTMLAPSLSPPATAPPVAVPAPTPPPDEQALITQALRSLRTLHQPTQALAALDEYANRFPGGSLIPEAARLRTEALLLLGHKQTVLAQLDDPTATGIPAGAEKLVVRGELRAAAQRWQAALEDFDAVLGGRTVSAPDGQRPGGTTDGPFPAGPQPGTDASANARSLFERALWGRATARSYLHDEAGARVDLHAYLARFPQGRFAKAARRLLGQAP